MFPLHQKLLPDRLIREPAHAACMMVFRLCSYSSSSWQLSSPFIFFLFLLLAVNLEGCSSAAVQLDYNNIVNSTEEYREQNGISHFRVLNRKILTEFTSSDNPYLYINITSRSPTIMDDEMVNVTIGGVLKPDKYHWVAMISPSDSKISKCPLNSLLYKETGDLSNLPLLCHYPVRAQYMSNDPAYLGCENKECRKKDEQGACTLHTCSATLSFHVVNFRTDVEFVLFSNGFVLPSIMKRSDPVRFTNPNMPLHGHLSSIDSTGTSMRLTWVSGNEEPQRVEYGDGLSASSVVSTFTKDQMCGSKILPSPAMDFGWHDPGYIHSAEMNGLKPSAKFSYRYGSNLAGWSDEIEFKTPPAAGSEELAFIVYGDMGKAPLDKSLEHFIQPGSLSVINAIAGEVAEELKIDSIFHIGDISYATGFLAEWDYFLRMIQPVASHVPYMTAIGNHERDFTSSGSIYPTTDSGGECGVPYETYFPMPISGKDRPWYSIEHGTVHFTVISTEHSFLSNSEQYRWIERDLESVDRSRTPWVIVAGHRPMYSSKVGILPAIDPLFVLEVEPLLMGEKVDLVFFGHIHNYERTCAVYRGKCRGMAVKDGNGVETYDGTNYTAPVHVIVGMAGFRLQEFPPSHRYEEWSLSRISEFGYVKVHATRKTIHVQLVNSETKLVRDNFQIIK